MFFNKLINPGIINKKNILPAMFFLIYAVPLSAQTNNNSDDSTQLATVTVTAFSIKSKWKDAGAPVVTINKRSLQKYDNNSLVPVLNEVPGIRMEERSPGSYRLSIRGSLLRSPFGVRNVKVYWDHIPLTDATGNTYLQLIDINSLQGAEIIKGPASSFYGANTGGAVLLKSDNDISSIKNIFYAGIRGGSFGMFGEDAGWKYSSKNFVSNLQQGHLQNNGYRDNSALRRDVLQWGGKWNISRKTSITFLSFYSNLHYETPGGITQAQMDSLPTLAGQPAGPVPGAVQQHAGVYNKTFFTGISVRTALAKNFENKTSIVINHTNFKNPFITNYEKRNELNTSARTNFEYSYTKNNFQLQANAGAELLYNHSDITDFDNNEGKPGDAQFSDKIKTTQYFLFAQLNAVIADKCIVQAGISNNAAYYNYTRITDPAGTYPVKKDAGPTASPRLSIVYKLSKDVSLYVQAAKGFSVPTLAEVLPSTTVFAQELKPESGWNYEGGIKGSVLHGRLDFSASYYYFALKDAIVRRTDSSGADYFINAGGTIQKGTELWLNAALIKNEKSFITRLNVWNSFASQPYKFDEYTAGANDYSGKALTGTPKLVNVCGIDVYTENNFYLNASFNYTSSIWLNDANTVQSKPYRLVQAKIGKQITLAKCMLDVYAGADNILNQLYSLGNDLNAFGGRYFNPAPERNYYAGVKVGF